MALPFKMHALDTDASDMSETVESPTLPSAAPAAPELPDANTAPPAGVPLGLSLDGEAPRLASAPLAAPPLSDPTPDGPELHRPAPLAADGPSLPVVSPVLSPVGAPAVSLPASPPSSESSGQTSVTSNGTSDGDAEPAAVTDSGHPMAHLLGVKSAPNEASRRAAEIRAAKKAKAKRVKLAVMAGFFVVAAIVGPPLLSWLTDAINEAGNTSTEEPAD